MCTYVIIQGVHNVNDDHKINNNCLLYTQTEVYTIKPMRVKCNINMLGQSKLQCYYAQLDTLLISE